jgi:2-haloacid dehalogenase
MVAAHTFDLLAAQKVGFRTALVKRKDEWGPGAPESASDDSLDAVVETFGELADRLGC